jgi:hypothetical protein
MELKVKRWISAATEAHMEIQQNGYCTTRHKEKSLQGIRAPQGNILEIKGGFINSKFQE